MDKIRAILKVVWQQRFWLLSLLAPLIAIPCWLLAAGKLQADFAKNKSAIESQFSAMGALRSAAVHGNESVNNAEKIVTRKVRQEVLAFWQELYDQQRQRVLFWPKVLNEEFVEFVSNKTFGEPITGHMRDIYWAYIKNRFDGLVTIVNAKKIYDGASGNIGGAGEGGMRGMERGMGGFGRMDMRRGMGGPGTQSLLEDDDEGGYILQWLDQAELQAKLAFPDRPTALQIWVTQEDLWVYETLLQVIANTNAARGATRPDNAAIRAIVALQVGREAAFNSKTPGNIYMPVAAGERAGMGGGMGDMDGGRAMMGIDPDGGPGRGFGADGEEGGGDAMLLTNRYLGPDGVALTGEVTELMGAEFRRLPIRMSLIMDERWLPTTLIECANAALPIQVERLQINPQNSAAGFESAGGGGGGGGFGGRRGFGERGMMQGAANASPGTSQFATIEIQGVVYIYNPPDPKVLTVPGDEESEDANVANGNGAAPTDDLPSENPVGDRPVTEDLPAAESADGSNETGVDSATNEAVESAAPVEENVESVAPAPSVGPP